jgi:hypothetical protein
MIEKPLSLPCGHSVPNRLGKGYWGPNSPSSNMRTLNNLCQAGWYYRQIEQLAAGLLPLPDLSPLQAMLTHLGKDYYRGFRRKLTAGA